MTLEASTVAGRARTMWCMRLSSALRTAFACAIVGGATLYGPRFITNEIRSAAFSYITAVLLVYDATSGDTFKGCWHALYGTVQVVPLAVLVRWIIAPTGGVPVSVAAVAVAVATFVVALPECTHLTAKRIAFGQIVLVCSDAVVSGGERAGVMHPVYVAASTALGALASVLALLIPYPGLACYKVRKLCRAYAENASQRINIYLTAFRAKDNHTKMELIFQAKLLSETGPKLLESIRILQEGMQWERPWSQYLNPNNLPCPPHRLQIMELQMRGMEYSLASSSSPAYPLQLIDQEQLSNVLQAVASKLQRKIEHLGGCQPPFHSTTQSEMEKPSLSSLQTMFPATLNHGWISFYFSCIDMLLNDPVVPRETQTQHTFTVLRTFKIWFRKLTCKTRLEFSFKCSLSLSLVVLFGLIFDRENGCCAGLTIATSFVTGRQAVFAIANTRAQGTAIGSVYGVICCFLFHYEELRLLALLPWIIFTSFLRYSKMYGQTGGVSAALGALMILGRKHYGDPNQFAIARLVEVFIGLATIVMVEILLQPVRAATLAKNHLGLTLSALRDCIKETRICKNEKNQTAMKFIELREKQRNFNSLVLELKKFVAEADLEPDFWYLPFRTSCYQKLMGSLTNIADLLYFITDNLKIISELSETTSNIVCKESHKHMNAELELFQETLSSSHLETANLTESQIDSQESMNEKFIDLETGKLQNPNELNVSSTKLEEAKRITDEESEDNIKKLRERMAQCLGATGFCISSLMKEIYDIKISIRELTQWENHSRK